MSEAPESWLLGLDVGATKLAVVVGRWDGSIVEEIRVPTPNPSTSASVIDTLVDLAERFMRDYGRPDAVGVSIGGPVDQDGVVHSPPNLPSWDRVPLTARLEQSLGLPVFVEHDAKAGALAEWLFGAGQGVDNLVFLTFGTGLGAGIIIDGRLCRGHTNLLGEVGHWRMTDHGPLAHGKHGSLEAYASGAGLLRLARWRHPDLPQRISTPGILDAARAGEPWARDVVDESAHVLGLGVSYLVDLLATELVVLGSLGVRAADLYVPTVQAVIDAECLPQLTRCRVVPAGTGEQIGSVAALAAAVHGRAQRRAPQPRKGNASSWSRVELEGKECQAG